MQQLDRHVRGRRAWAGAMLLALAPACGAQTCEALRGQIDAKIRASGVASFELEVIDMGALGNGGRVVGRCDNGRSKIVYRQRGMAGAGVGAASAPKPASRHASAAGAPPRPAAPPMLTECRDGTVSLGGTCKR
jgi:hypothetical protein